MKKARVWDHSVRVRMYELLIQEFGKYSRHTFRLTGGTSPSLVLSDENAVYQRVYEKMLSEGSTLDIPPSSADALKQQVAWATTTQDPNKINPGHLKVQRQNRLAAYEAGFMSWKDIDFLETIADSRVLIDSK